MFTFFSAQKMVTLMPDTDDQQIDRTQIDDNSKNHGNKIEDEVKYITNNGYDLNNLYGLLAVPFLGIVLSIFIYLPRKYQCCMLVRLLNFLLHNNDVQNDEENDSYGSQSTATPPIIIYPRDFSAYNTSQTSSYTTTQFSDKEIQTSLPTIEEKIFDSSDAASRGSSLNEEDIIYINNKEPNLSDSDPSIMRSGTKYT